jgi:hypothetical protein
MARPFENMARLVTLLTLVRTDSVCGIEPSRGITSYTVLENIAYNLGYDDPGAFAVERWMMSAGHRENILDAGFKSMAVGFCRRRRLSLLNSNVYCSLVRRSISRSICFSLSLNLVNDSLKFSNNGVRFVLTLPSYAKINWVCA